MKKISKFLTLILMLSALVLGLTACGDPTKNAETIVSKELDTLKAFDDNTFKEFFGEDSLSSFGLEGVDEEQIKTFFKAIVDNLSYTIVSSEKVDDKTITVKTDITAIKMETVMKKFMEDIVAFGSSKEAANISQEDAVKKSVELLVNAVTQPNLETITTTVDIKVLKTDDGWSVQVDKDLLNAIYGGMFTMNP